MSQYAEIKLDPTGVIYDTDPHDAPLKSWTDVLNMRFNDGASEKIAGETLGTTTTAQATHLLFNGNHTDPLWLYFGDGIARVTNFTTDKDIEGAALSSGTAWDSALFNLIPVVNNTLDTPRYWAGDFTAPDTLANLPAFEANTVCKAIRPFRSFLIALNTTTSGVQASNRVLWSTSSDAGALPASWDITDPSTLAGDAYLTDDRGEIIDGAQLRDMFVIYKTHSTYLMRLIGGQSVMRIDKVQVNSGLLAKNCIVEFKGKHFVVADGDIVLFDGQNVESIAEKRVKDKIFNDIDSDNFDASYVVRSDKDKEIWFCYPSTGQDYSDKAAIWNWENNTWTFRELYGTKYITQGVANFASSPTWDSLTSTTWDSYNSTWKSFSSNPTVDTLISAGYGIVEQSALHTDIGFDSPGDWTVANCTVSGSVSTLSASGLCGQTATSTILSNIEYKVVIDLDSYTGSGVQILIGGTTVATVQGSGTYYYMTATAPSSDFVGLSTNALSTAVVSSLSISFSSNDLLGIIGDGFDTYSGAMPSKLEKVTMDLGDPDHIKIVKSVTPRITGEAGTKVYIRLGVQNNPDDVIAWGDEQLYTVGNDREAFFTEKGRYISIRMRTQDIGANWTCHGFYIKAALSGRH